jgi:hypothetical protein
MIAYPYQAQGKPPDFMPSLLDLNMVFGHARIVTVCIFISGGVLRSRVLSPGLALRLYIDQNADYNESCNNTLNRLNCQPQLHD